MEAKILALFSPEGQEAHKEALEFCRLWARVSWHFPLPLHFLRPDCFINFEYRRSNLNSPLAILNDGPSNPHFS
jgi:hypothetical protein